MDQKSFFYLMELCVTNALMLYKAKTGSQSMILPDFQLALILRLCQTFQDISNDENDDASPPCSSVEVDAPNRLRGGFKSHILEELPPTAKKQKPQRKCKLCSKKGRCRDTRYFCKECKVALCQVPCYAEYHSKKIF